MTHPFQVLHGVFKEAEVRFWDALDEAERAEVLDAVRYTVGNRIEGAHLRHERWVTERRREGWTRGTVFDAEKKYDPNLCGWDKLPPIERHRMRLFVGIVNALA